MIIKSNAFKLFMVILLCFLSFIGCEWQGGNQRYEAVSKDSQFVAMIEVSKSNSAGSSKWIVSILSESEKVAKYVDQNSDFSGRLNVYWAWDRENRFWLYNSDDGFYWFWELGENNKWSKSVWDRSFSITPPTGIRRSRKRKQ